MTSLAPVDLTQEADAQAWVDGAVATHGGVDVLYNNASVARVGPWDELTLEGWRFAMTYELDIVYISTKAAWPHLVARGGGVIINVASVAAKLGAGFVHQHAHGAAKGGVLAFTKHLVVSGAPHRIRAVSISPGMIVTPPPAPWSATRTARAPGSWRRSRRAASASRRRSPAWPPSWRRMPPRTSTAPTSPSTAASPPSLPDDYAPSAASTGQSRRSAS